MSESLSLKNEILRKAIHLCSSMIAFGFFFLDQKNIITIVSIALFLCLLLEYFRFSSLKIKQLYLTIFGRVTRHFEHKSLTGATYVLISSFIILILFDKYICILSILVMSISDSAAAIIGTIYGKTKIKNKSLEGSSAFFLASFIIAVAMIPYLSFLQSLIAITIGTIVELFPIKKIDDNLSVPIVIAIIMSIKF